MEKAKKTESQATRHASKFLTFVLAGETYGVRILEVREIIALQPITAVPNAPGYVRGVINLRGKIVPVVDLRAKFGMLSVEPTRESCIVVMDVREGEMGVLVDKVAEVLSIRDEEVEPLPSFGVETNTDFILGVGRSGSKVTILVDITRVLTEEKTFFSGLNAAK